MAEAGADERVCFELIEVRVGGLPCPYGMSRINLEKQAFIARVSYFQGIGGRSLTFSA